MADLPAAWHMELGSNDTAATKEFLTNVFGMEWNSAPPEAGMEYHMAYRPGEPSTAVRPAMPTEKGPSQTPYYLVSDIEKTIADAESNGALIILPKTPIPGGDDGQEAFMSWFQIPGGPIIAVMQNGQ